MLRFYMPHLLMGWLNVVKETCCVTCDECGRQGIEYNSCFKEFYLFISLVDSYFVNSYI